MGMGERMIMEKVVLGDVWADHDRPEMGSFGCIACFRPANTGLDNEQHLFEAVKRGARFVCFDCAKQELGVKDPTQAQTILVALRLPENENTAMFLAMAVRNAIEPLHEQIPNATMEKLNRAVRNAIYTGLEALDEYPHTRQAVEYVAFTRARIPDYWEPPVVLPDTINEDRNG